jgi:hypothetical protein
VRPLTSPGIARDGSCPGAGSGRRGVVRPRGG